MGYGFYKVGAVSMRVALGDVNTNAQTIIDFMNKAEEEKVELVVFPELCITGYTCNDLFSRSGTFEASEKALKMILEKTSDLNVIACIGIPILDHARSFNCAVYIQNGIILGVVPKTYIPNYSEFYEKRWFVSSKCRVSDSVTLCGMEVEFNENLLLKGRDGLIIGTELCEDLWVDAPPSGMLCRAGANIIVNLSASNDIIGKREYRRNLVSMQSARCRCGYVYASCGWGESSTDIVLSGHSIIADNGHIVNEVTDLYAEGDMITGLVDIQRCIHDKTQSNSNSWGEIPGMVEVDVNSPVNENILPAFVDPFPFVPHDETSLSQRCEEILALQAKGLMQRLSAINCKNVVIGISGGLDSTLALLVCVTAFDKLSIDRKGIHAITMPGFGTSDRTHNIADKLMAQLGVTYKTIDICEACKQHLDAIGHPMDVFDIAYENTQARERTQILFDYANMVNAIVIGTGDMSELALGWCTYNGDHMSNYAVNSSVPKTLVKYLVRAYALTSEENLKNTLMDVFDLPISPELLPTDDNGEIAQKTEDSIGKYDLHDFFLYHYLRNGASRDKIFALAQVAFPKVSEEEISKTLDMFYRRFRTQQFKRSCIPDGVKIGSVALSPRGDLRLPSDLSVLI